MWESIDSSMWIWLVLMSLRKCLCTPVIISWPEGFYISGISYVEEFCEHIDNVAVCSDILQKVEVMFDLVQNNIIKCLGVRRVLGWLSNCKYFHQPNIFFYGSMLSSWCKSRLCAINQRYDFFTYVERKKHKINYPMTWRAYEYLTTDIETRLRQGKNRNEAVQANGLDWLTKW